jgi:hypothetical protein
MQRFTSGLLLLFIFMCAMVATERQALAYVDPGSGLLVLQTMASMAAACGYFFRRRIKNLFGRKTSQDANVTAAADNKVKHADAA